MTDCPALTVRNLSTGYPGNLQAIQNINFEIQCGERVAVLGPNGAGKSTLFKAIVGLVPFTSGEISIHGKDCRTSHSMIGYVPQHNEIDWDFPATVLDVVMMGRIRKIGWFKLPRRLDYKVVFEKLEQVGLSEFAHRQINELSGGQKRRVFIARALAQETDVILLDEPFSGVDVAAEEEIMSTIEALKGDQITVVLATHDIQMAINRFDKMLMINQTVVAFGDHKEVFTPEKLQKTFGGHVGIITEGERTVFVIDEHGAHT